jgi:hypothetical protein
MKRHGSSLTVSTSTRLFSGQTISRYILKPKVWEDSKGYYKITKTKLYSAPIDSRTKLLYKLMKIMRSTRKNAREKC